MLRQGFRKAYVVGVGMTKFEKPGRRPNFDYPDMAKESVGMALKDSKLSYEAIEQAYAGYVYGDSTCGQRALYQVCDLIYNLAVQEPHSCPPFALLSRGPLCACMTGQTLGFYIY